MEADTSEEHSSMEFMEIFSLTFMFDLIIPAAFLSNNATNKKYWWFHTVFLRINNWCANNCNVTLSCLVFITDAIAAQQ
jgi:hypothetical protein